MAPDEPGGPPPESTPTVAPGPRPRRRRRGRRGRKPADAAATGAEASPSLEAGAGPDGPSDRGPRQGANRRRRGRRGGPAGARPDGPPRAAPPPPPPPPQGQPDFIPRTPRGAGVGDRDRGRGERRERRPPRGTPTPPAAPLIPSVSHLAEAAPGTDPLSTEELVEMREHLVFLRDYKEALRLRLNAAEDLMVNGRRDPTDRGVCRHLLGKVDRSVIEAAVGREPMKSNTAARSRFLAGAIRLTADVGVLLAYLETLAPQRSHAEAAAAFAEVVRRIDFESLSSTRLARLLQVLTETFEGHERVQVLFGLLDGDAFRRAFDAAATALPSEVAAIFAPLRAVHRRLRAEPSAAHGTGDPHLAVGLEQVMAAPDPVLRAFPETLRTRMLELALDPGIPAALADRAAGVLLTSLARAGKTFTRLAMRRAAQLLARHVDDRARATLEEVRRAAPGYAAAERWLAALGARHVGRIALTEEPPVRGRLGAGFWLDGQRPVWLRTAPASAAETLAREAELQAALALPGVAPVVAHGLASGIPYVALLAAGRPWRLDGETPPDPPVGLALATQAARILRALALAGIALPDAEPERFCLASERAPTLVLTDLAGARATARDEAEAVTAASARTLARRLVPSLAADGDLATLVQALDHALLFARRD